MSDATDYGRLFTDLVRAETRIYNAVDDRLRAEIGTTVGRFEILKFIAARDDCRVHDLANEFAITVGAISKVVDRLEAAGWCKRATNPTDRRSSHLVATAAGRRLVAKGESVYTEEIRRRVLAALPERRVGPLAGALSELRTSLEADGATGGVGRQRR